MAADWVTRGLARTPTVEVVDLGALYVQGRTADPASRPIRSSSPAGTAPAAWWPAATTSPTTRWRSGRPSSTAPRARCSRRCPGARAGRTSRSRRWSCCSSRSCRPGGRARRRFTPVHRPALGAAAACRLPGVRRRAGRVLAGPLRPRGAEFFQCAVGEDSTFPDRDVWLAFVGANGAGCALTDSVARALVPGGRRFNRFDQLTLGISAARCRNHWHEAFRLAAEQAGAPAAVDLCRVHGRILRAHERAAARGPRFLRSIDPAHELGWLSDSAKSVYWRDLTTAEHLLGETVAPSPTRTDHLGASHRSALPARGLGRRRL